MDALIIITKNNFKFISVTETDSYLAIRGKYVFSKEKSYPGITKQDIRSETEILIDTKLDLPILYFEGQTNTAADSALTGTILSTALFGTVALFSYIYSKESRKIIIRENAAVLQMNN